LVFRSNPIRDVKLVALWVIKAGDLLRQEIHRKTIQIKPFRDQSKGLRAAFGGIAFLGVLFVVHLAEDIGADFFPGAYGLLKGAFNSQPVMALISCKTSSAMARNSGLFFVEGAGEGAVAACCAGTGWGIS